MKKFIITGIAVAAGAIASVYFAIKETKAKIEKEAEEPVDQSSEEEKTTAEKIIDFVEDYPKTTATVGATVACGVVGFTMSTSAMAVGIGSVAAAANTAPAIIRTQATRGERFLRNVIGDNAYDRLARKAKLSIDKSASKIKKKCDKKGEQVPEIVKDAIGDPMFGDYKILLPHTDGGVDASMETIINAMTLVNTALSTGIPYSYENFIKCFATTFQIKDIWVEDASPSDYEWKATKKLITLKITKTEDPKISKIDFNIPPVLKEVR